MRYVILGSSASSVSAVKEIRNHDKDGEIILVSKDDFIYSRCMLHYNLGGHRTKEELTFVEKDFFEKFNVNFMPKLACTDVDTNSKTVTLSNDETLTYDKLFIGTGSNCFIPPIENLNTPKNVVGLRNYDDVEFILNNVNKDSKVAVLGAGLVGMDAIIGLLEKGLTNLSLIEFENKVLPKQLDKRASSAYEKKLEEKGVSLFLGEKLESVEAENDSVKKLLLASNKVIECDLLIITVGVRPNTGFLQNTDITLERGGIVIDKFGKTNIDDIYAGGDVTGLSPIWPVAVKEGLVAGANMCNVEKTADTYFASKSTMNFFGINTMSVGDVNADGEEIIQDDGNVFKKVIHKDGKIIGALLQNDISYGGVLTQLIANNIDVSKVKKPLFNVDYSDFFNLDENFSFFYDECK